MLYIQIKMVNYLNESCPKTMKLVGWKGSEVKVIDIGVKLWCPWEGLVQRHLCAKYKRYTSIGIWAM